MIKTSERVDSSSGEIGSRRSAKSTAAISVFDASYLDFRLLHRFGTR
jgi:hypothetical protein